MKIQQAMSRQARESTMSIQVVQAVKSSAGRHIGVFLWGLGLSLAAVASPGSPQLAPSAAFLPTPQPGDALISPEAPAAPTSQSQTVAPGETPTGITPEAWSRIMADVQAKTYTVQPDKTGSLLAGNPAQHLAARFSPRDVALTPEQRTRPVPSNHDHVPPQQPGAPFELRTRSVDGIAAQAVTPVATANRVEYHHAGYTEWYVNEAKGFEQGWTLDAPATNGQSPLIRIGVTGARTVAEGADSIRIEDSQGKLRYRYAGLKVIDAAQRMLPAHLRLAQPGIIEIAVDDRGAQYPLTVDPALTATQAVTLSDPGATANDVFGNSVAVNGDTVVVGALKIGAQGAQGAAYVYCRNQGGAGLWGLAATLVDPAPVNSDYFASSIAVYGDNVVVGALGTSDYQGAAYVFNRNQGGAGLWGLSASLSDPLALTGDQFGSAVAVNGSTLVVGALNSGGEGAAYIYSLEGAAHVFFSLPGSPSAATGQGPTWQLVASLSDPAAASEDFFGGAVAVDGDTVAVGGYGTSGSRGAAYVFSRNQGGAGLWGQVASLSDPLATAQDRFGISVGVNGDTLVVGAYGSSGNKGAAYIYSRNQGGAGLWGRAVSLADPKATATDYFGFSVAVYGDTVVVGAEGTSGTLGAAYLFNRNQGGVGAWGLGTSLGDPAASNSVQFGFSVAVDGDTVVVGAQGTNGNEGAAYIFDVSGGTYAQVAAIGAPTTAGNGAGFGAPVAMNGDTLVVGAYAAIGYEGEAYIYSRNQGGAGRWGLAASLSDPLATADDYFGEFVTVDGDTVAVGAFGTNNSQGMAYVFGRNQGGAGHWGLAATLSDPGTTALDDFGSSVAVNGDTLVVGSYHSGNAEGTAYIYSRNLGGAGLWGLAASLSDPGAMANDCFGASVAVYGDTVVVGAYCTGNFQGAAYIYNRNQGGAGIWGQVASLSDPAAMAGDRFGFAVALRGDTLAVGAFGTGSQQGAAYIYDRNLNDQNGAGAWGLATTIEGAGVGRFGIAVAVDGDTLVVGAQGSSTTLEGAAYIYSRNQGGAGLWGIIASLSDPPATDNDNFGYSVAVNGGTVVVGAYGTNNYKGEAYIYSLATDLPASVATPASLSFAPQASGTTSPEQTVTLKNTGSGDLTVSSFSFSGTYAADFAVFSNGCGSAVAPGGSCTVQVEFSPTGSTPGTLVADLDIASNAPLSPNKIVLSGSLILPPTVTPASLAFGDVVVGTTSAAKTVTLDNRQATAISVSSGISGSGFAISGGTCGSTLAAGKECTVLVTFAPAALGAVTGTLTLTDSPDSGSPHSIALTGTGSTQTTDTPTTLAFGDVAVGNTSAAKTVTLENHETVAINVSTGISGSSFKISGGTCGSTLAAGKDCTVLVTFTPSALGAVSGTLTLTDSPDSNSPHSIALSGTGSTQTTVTPTTLAFGNVFVHNTSAAKTITLENHQSTTISVDTGISGSGFAISGGTCGSTLAAGKDCTVLVTFTPTALGAVTGTLLLTTSPDSASPHSIALSGTGVQVE